MSPPGVSYAPEVMARAAGYRQTFTMADFAEFQRRLPGLLKDEGPIFAELITGLADQTPMTSPRGTPSPPSRSRTFARA